MPLAARVPIDDYALLDLDAPTLPAYEHVGDSGVVRWGVWCRHCRRWHWHGQGEGHREAHRHDPFSGYEKTGYSLAHAGKWSEQGWADRQ